LLCTVNEQHASNGHYTTDVMDNKFNFDKTQITIQLTL